MTTNHNDPTPWLELILLFIFCVVLALTGCATSMSKRPQTQAEYCAEDPLAPICNYPDFGGYN